MISRTGRVNSRGFTLVEVCLVGLILSLLFSLSWPLLSHSIRRNQLELACNDIAVTFRCARDYALNEGTRYSVHFDGSGRKYWLSADGSAQLNDSFHKAHTWPEELHMENISSRQVGFYPDGTSQDFEITFKDAGGNGCRLRLHGSTGVSSVTSL